MFSPAFLSSFCSFLSSKSAAMGCLDELARSTAVRTDW